MQLRAPSSWLTALQNLINAPFPTNANAMVVRVSPILPPPTNMGPALPQLNQIQIAAAINPGAQTVTVPPFGPAPFGPAPFGPVWLSIPSVVVRALAGINAGSMPSEALQLSQECVVDAQPPWATVFQTLGFTPYVATITPVPILA